MSMADWLTPPITGVLIFVFMWYRDRRINRRIRSQFDEWGNP